MKSKQYQHIEKHVLKNNRPHISKVNGVWRAFYQGPHFSGMNLQAERFCARKNK